MEEHQNRGWNMIAFKSDCAGFGRQRIQLCDYDAMADYRRSAPYTEKQFAQPPSPRRLFADLHPLLESRPRWLADILDGCRAGPSGGRIDSHAGRPPCSARNRMHLVVECRRAARHRILAIEPRRRVAHQACLFAMHRPVSAGRGWWTSVRRPCSAS